MIIILLLLLRLLSLVLSLLFLLSSAPPSTSSSLSPSPPSFSCVFLLCRPPSQLPSSCYHGNIFLERLRVLRSGERTKKLAFDLIYQGDLDIAQFGCLRNRSSLSFYSSFETVSATSQRYARN
ncbi:unnamed protein product [Dibothriocephalus latus]|uniref:Secreted protein n=1 Tax=Dibothriocephalus latus TaxID=60516 RepID=A0A3P7PHV6_DIBLA|nr:unnamed protein product [Dibothriocephalus latus]